MYYRSVASRIRTRPDVAALLDSDEEISKLFELPSSLPKERVDLYRRLYQGIGNTPCYTVRLPNDNILRVKTEYLNPMGNSHYSRSWLPYLFIAELLDIIEPGKTRLIEVTSGSSGISLAIAAKLLNYDLTLIVPEMLPAGRTLVMERYGAELIKVPGYVDECVEVLRDKLSSHRYFPCNHSEERADIQVKIIKRIAAEYCASYKHPDYAIIGLGNGTSTYAIFEYLKNHSPNTKLVAYHPDVSKSDLVLGLYAPNMELLRHIEPALALSDERIFTNSVSLEDVRNYFAYDTELANVGESTLYAAAMAMEKSKQVSGNEMLIVGYDKKDRYL